MNQVMNIDYCINCGKPLFLDSTQFGGYWCSERCKTALFRGMEDHYHYSSLEERKNKVTQGDI